MDHKIIEFYKKLLTGFMSKIIIHKFIFLYLLIFFILLFNQRFIQEAQAACGDSNSPGVTTTIWCADRSGNVDSVDGLVACDCSLGYGDYSDSNDSVSTWSCDDGSVVSRTDCVRREIHRDSSCDNQQSCYHDQDGEHCSTIPPGGGRCDCLYQDAGSCSAPPSCKSNGIACGISSSDCCSGLFCYNGVCRGCDDTLCQFAGFSGFKGAFQGICWDGCDNKLGSVDVPSSVCTSEQCYCCGPTSCTPSCPDPSTYCPNQPPGNGCGGTCPTGTKDCTTPVDYSTCSFRNLSCPTSATTGSNFNVSYEYFTTGDSLPDEVRSGLTNIVAGTGCEVGSADILWCEASDTGKGSWRSESRTVKCPATAGDLKITAGCFAEIRNGYTCPANNKYSGSDRFNEEQECTVQCVAPTLCAPDTSQACCIGATNLWNNTATNPNKATATGVWLLASQFPESAPPNNEARCCSDDKSEVYISPTNARACDGTSACCNANDYVMNGQCYTTFSLPAPANVRSTSQTTTSITWAWNAVSGATYYLLHLNNNTPVNAGNVTTRLQSGLTPNTSYWLEAAACNLCGCSAYSSRVTVTTLNANQPPGQPTLEPVP